MTTILAAAIPFIFGLMITFLWWNIKERDFAGSTVVYHPISPIRPKIRRS